MSKDEILRRFSDIDNELKTLTDHNPRSAIERARSLVPDGILDQINIWFNQAEKVVQLELG